MPQASATHPHKTRIKSKSAKRPQGTPPVAIGQSKNQSFADTAPPAKRAHAAVKDGQSNESDSIATMLVLESAPNLNIQEAFSSLLNAHDILSASHDTLSDETEGEDRFPQGL